MVIALLFLLAIPPCRGQLKHMRQHGHDHHHQHQTDDGGIGGGGRLPPIDQLPDGIDVLPPGHKIEGHPYRMKAGYRVYDALAPPWSASPASIVSKGEALQFLDAAEAAAHGVRKTLRRDYGEYADSVFGKEAGSGGGVESSVSHASPAADEKIADRIVLNMLRGLGGSPSSSLSSPSKSSSFHVAVTGQSNMAAHGSYFDESVPFVMGRLSAPAFAAA